MAIKFFNENLISDHGIIHTGSFTAAPSNTYYSSWANFVSNYGYNGGFFDVTQDFLACPWGSTITKKLFTLRNGNYAELYIDKSASGSNYTDTIRIRLYNSDDSYTGFQFNYATAHSGSDVNNGKWDYYGFIFVVGYNDATNNIWWCRCDSAPIAPNAVYVDTNQLSTSYANYIGWMLGSFLPDDPYGLDENHTPSGGFGDFDYSGDDDLPPSLPTLSAAQVGFVSLWNPSQQEMKDLADYLWTGTFDLTNFKKLFTDPMECILSVGIVPVTPTTGTATEIVFGGSSHSGVNAKPITSQFVSVDLGKVHINGQSASALDYSPYVKVSIFLPYCGTYALDADDVMDADVALEYHIDIYTGACVAYLTITKTNSDGSTLHSTLYQFTGNCLASIPITGNDHSQFIQSMLFMGAAVAATVATSGAGAPAIEGAAATGDVAGASAVNAVTASSAVNSVMSMKPNVLRSGNLSSTAGLLGKQRPCITVTWPNLCRPDTEHKLLGMPVHKSGALSDFEGFTIVSAVHVESILCTEIEKQMIEQMLYKGVIV